MNTFRNSSKMFGTSGTPNATYPILVDLILLFAKDLSIGLWEIAQ